MERANILIVDEFAKADEKIINDVFVPMLTSPRIPPYASLTPEELATIPEEVNRQYYLSSIRGADEWSFKRLLNYLDYMLNGDKNYMVVSLPYHLGVKNRYISKMLVEQGFRNAIDDYESQIAEYLAIPIRGSGNTFFKYSDMSKARDNVKCITAMSDDEYILYKDNIEKWPYYVEKMPNEIRILAMDIALIESAKNDNSMMWIIRLIPDGGKYKKILAYGESMHGLNSTIQGKRAKQLFYETQCDYFVVDSMGSGVGLVDFCTTETYDEIRGISYPAWGFVNPDETNLANHVMSSTAVPVMYAVKTPIQLKSSMFINMKDMISTGDLSMPTTVDEGIEYLDKVFKFYKIEDSDLRGRLIGTYTQTDMLVNEAINLEQVNTQGYINLKEKPGRRKDRVMALAYGLYYAKILDDDYRREKNDSTLLDYILFA